MAATSTTTPTIDHLLNLVPDHPALVLTHLTATPTLAAQRDAHGYSLLHAAASYSHADLLAALVREYGVDPNLVDEDDETALFAVEDPTLAALLLELGTDPRRKNAEGVMAGEKIEAEGEFPAVVEFFRSKALLSEDGDVGVHGQENGVAGEGEEGTGSGQGLHAPPPLPAGIQINVGTMSDADAGGEPDPEFRRRIEELAARGDFEGEDGQRELRRLVEEAVTGISSPGEGQGPATRRRVG